MPKYKPLEWVETAATATHCDIWTCVQTLGMRVCKVEAKVVQHRADASYIWSVNSMTYGVSNTLEQAKEQITSIITQWDLLDPVEEIGRKGRIF